MLALWFPKPILSTCQMHSWKDQVKTGSAFPHRAESRAMEPECVYKKDGGPTGEPERPESLLQPCLVWFLNEKQELEVFFLCQ